MEEFMQMFSLLAFLFLAMIAKKLLEK